MPASHRQAIAPTHDWEQIQLLTSWPEQLAYELIRPVVLFGEPLTARAQQTALSEMDLLT